MTRLNDHLVDGSLRSVLRGKLALLHRTFDEQICAFVIRQRLVGQRVVERQAVPVRLSDGLIISTLVTMRLSEPGVGDLRSGSQVPEIGPRRQKTCYFNAVHLHDDVFAPVLNSSIKPCIRGLGCSSAGSGPPATSIVCGVRVSASLISWRVRSIGGCLTTTP